mgnify:CR=1 FL=1
MAIIKYSEFVEEDDTFDKIEKHFKSIRDLASDVAKSTKGSLNVVKPEDTEEIKRLAVEIETLKKTIRSLEKAEEESLKVKQKKKELSRSEIQQMEEERVALNKTKQEIRAVARMKLAEADSIEQMRAKLALVTIAWTKLSTAERENTDRGQRLVRSKKELTQEIKRLERETDDHRRNVGNYKEIVDELVIALRHEKTELQGNVSALKRQQSQIAKNTAEWNQYEKKIKEVEGRLDKVNSELGETPSQKPQGGGGLFSSLGGEVSGAVESRGSGSMGMLGGVVSKLGPIGIAIGAVVAGVTAVGKAVLDTEKRFTQLSGTIQKITGETGASLNTLVENTEAMIKTFDADENQLIRAQNVIMKEFGASAEEAGKLIEQGFLSGANAQDDMLESIIEYSTQVKASGGDAQLLLNVLNRSGRQGIFSDKGIDAVKEFGLRIREQTKATRESLEGAFGKSFSDTVLKGVSDGSLTTIQALEMISEKMNDTTIPTERLQTVIADTFGGAGEDAGLSFLQSLKDITSQTNELVDYTNPLVKAQSEQLELNKDLAREQNLLSKEFAGTSMQLENLGIKLKTGFFHQLRGAKESLNDLSEGFQGVWEGVSEGNLEAMSGGLKKILSQYPLLREMSGGFLELTEAEENAMSVMRVHSELTEVATSLMKDELTEMNNKLTALHSNNLSEEERLELIQDIKDEYPDYIQYIFDEEGGLIDLTKARKNMNRAIVESAVAKAKELMINQKIEKYVEQSMSLLDAQRKASEEGFGTAVLEGLTYGFYTSYRDEVKNIKDSNKELLADLNNLGGDMNGIIDEITNGLGDIDLSAGINNVINQINQAEANLSSLRKQLATYDEDNLSYAQKQIVTGIKNQIDAEEKRLFAMEKKKREILELGDDGDEGGNGTGKTSKRYIPTGKTKEAKELDLLEQIRIKRNELNEESLEKSLEEINIRMDRETKSFEKLRKEQDEYFRKKMISEKEYNRRVDEINQITSLTESLRAKEIHDLRVKYIDEEYQKKVQKIKDANDLELLLYKRQLLERGDLEIEIAKQIESMRLQLLERELSARKKEQEDRLNEIKSLESNTSRTEEDDKRLAVLKEAKDLTKEIVALEIEIVETKNKQNNQMIRQVANLEALQNDERLILLEKSIKDQNKLIDKQRQEEGRVSNQELENLKQLYQGRYDLKRQMLEKEYDLELSMLQEGSIEYQIKEQEKKNALLKMEHEFADELEKINADIAKNTADQWKQIADMLQTLITQLLDKMEESFQKAQEKAEERVEKQQEAQDIQRERAEKGLSNTLAFETKELAKREAELIAQEKRLERIQKIKALYTAYTSNASNPNEKNPLAKTLRDFAMLEAITASFAEGGYTGDGRRFDVAGAVHKGEYVIDKPTTQALGLKNLSMSEMKNRLIMATMMKNDGAGILNQNVFGKQLNIVSDSTKDKTAELLLREIKLLREDMRGIPDRDLDLVEVSGKFIELMKTTKKGNYVQRERLRINRFKNG